ncbi:hypothetical protein AU255_16025 [Methyloprofundus sedimenti]|uniref:Uncharacterized protein n=1 Tax=Methyloprofundus sedimenti TaxID=1420851 RepID=A0A1V8M2C9_9GAMM|nr:hypothetical protein [Methyloprofundus sedimenti]OQK15717.1 hypothetical protein AU255_16025 [Methyloprofundus sedimenti]
MITNMSIKKIALYSLTGVALAASQSTFAHTRLQNPVIAEQGTSYNNEVIGHTCTTAGGEHLNVIGTVVVFPDGVDSTLTVGGEASAKTVADYVSNWGSPVQLIQNNDVFPMQDEITDSLGNVVGFWAGAGEGLKHNLTGVIPFRTSAVNIEPTSCAKSVTFRIAIADVCTLTKDTEFSTDALNLWTPAVGSKFEIEGSSGYDSPATLKVERSSALPEKCGEGVDVIVTPSAAQLNRDMPVKINGTQIWPL